MSHHFLGHQSLIAENVAKLVGIALGTLFRFWAYRRFVFNAELSQTQDVEPEVSRPR